jgi:hypothetical protein
MAVLTTEQRREIWAKVQQDLSASHEPIGAISKSDLRDALDAVDVWVSTSAASFNSALPEPAKSVLTPLQKSRALLYIVRKRFQEGI